jgi:hypothetical protein
MSLSYGGSARRIKARRPFSRKSVPQLRMKFEALGFKMASDPTMMTNRAPLGGQGPKLAANAIWSAITGGERVGLKVGGPSDDDAHHCQ